MNDDISGLDLMTQKEAEELIRMSASWFEHQRAKKKGIPYHKVGGRVFYLRKDLLAWFGGRRFSK